MRDDHNWEPKSRKRGQAQPNQAPCSCPKYPVRHLTLKSRGHAGSTPARLVSTSEWVEQRWADVEPRRRVRKWDSTAMFDRENRKDDSVRPASRLQVVEDGQIVPERCVGSVVVAHHPAEAEPERRQAPGGLLACDERCAIVRHCQRSALGRQVGPHRSTRFSFPNQPEAHNAANCGGPGAEPGVLLRGVEIRDIVRQRSVAANCRLAR